MTHARAIPLALSAGLLLAVVASPRAHAISREEDIIRDLGETFKAPSVFPPNPVLRPSLDATLNHDGNGDNGGERVLAPLGPDLGPGAESVPDAPPVRAYPFIVALVESDRSPQEGFICAGTLIAPHWVLTAAHCTFAWTRRWPIDPQPYAVFTTTRLSQPGPKYPVAKVFPHPDYDARTLKNDLALVLVDTKGSTPGAPLQLEGPPPSAQVGEIGHILGWGVTNLVLLQRLKPDTLQLIQVAVRSEGCFAAGNFPTLKGTGVFCASSLFRHHDTCYRFGGGPVFLRDAKGSRYLAGLVSWSAVCPPEVDKMNLYLDVQHFVPWIKSTIAANGGPG